MKKILISTILALFVLSGCAGEEKKVLKVFNWGAYIDETVITEFEDLYDVRVIYDNYDSNELMYTKIQSGEYYDILVPTDHMVERLIAEDYLQPLDLSKLSNLGNLYPDLLNRSFDPNNTYSIPYFWGNIGIIYNKNTVDVADLENEGWMVLNNPKYADRIYIYDSARDAFMVAQKALGYSVNSTDEAQIEAAFELLKEINETTRPIYIDETIIDNMITEQKDLAVDFSGDAAYIISQNENLSFFVPEEGTNIWMDSMIIPKNAKEVDLAHKWIDFMLDNEVALKNTIYVGYTSPNISAFETVTGPGGDYEGNIAYQPRMDNPNDEVYKYDDALKEIITDKWTRVKAQ